MELDAAGLATDSERREIALINDYEQRYREQEDVRRKRQAVLDRL